MAKTNVSVVDYGPGDSSVAWTALTLGGTWANASGYRAAQYSRDADGKVSLRGQIDTGNHAAGQTVATLPVGFRPGAKEQFTVQSEVAAGVSTSLIVDTDGTIKIGAVAATASSSLSLSGISFYTA